MNNEIDRICDVLEGKIYKRILFSLDSDVLRDIMCKELVPQLIDKRWYYITELKLYSPEEVNTYTLNEYHHSPHYFSSFIHHHEDSKTWIARHWTFEK